MEGACVSGAGDYEVADVPVLGEKAILLSDLKLLLLLCRFAWCLVCLIDGSNVVVKMERDVFKYCWRCQLTSRLYRGKKRPCARTLRSGGGC